jgi:tyrosine-protein kinase Etk/Wzc
MEKNSQLVELELAANGFLPSDTPAPAREVTFIDILTQLALRKRLIAYITGAAIVAAVILAFILPVRYASTIRIMPPQQTQSSANMLMAQLANSGSLSMAALAGSGLGLKNPNDIYIGLLNSRPVADDIIHKFDLTASYHSRDMTAARKRLAELTSIVSEKSGMIAITVTDQDKKRVAEMANAYVRELRDLTTRLAVTEASHRRLFVAVRAKP